MSLAEEDKIKFKEITEKTFKQQACFTLNAFWEDGLKDKADELWKFVSICEDLSPKKKEGNELDEFQAHRFLELVGETLTVIALRDRLRKIDIDMNRRMALAEYMVFWGSLNVHLLCTRPQGSNKKEIEDAQAKLAEVQTAFDEVQKQLEEQKTIEKELKEKRDAAMTSKAEAEKRATEAKAALESAKKSEESAIKAETESKASAETSKKAADESKKAADEAAAAAEEQRKAVQALEDEQNAYNTKLTELEKAATDTTLSAVKRGKAVNERDQLKSEDPLPLRKAKISADSALRKLDKAKAKAEDLATKAKTAADEAQTKADAASVAREEAEKKRAESDQAATEAERAAEEAKADAESADAAAKAAEEKTKEVELSVDECNKQMDEARAMLEEAKKKPGNSSGDLWWMERELKEKEKYMPSSKKGKK